MSEAKNDERHAIERPARMTCSAAGVEENAERRAQLQKQVDDALNNARYHRELLHAYQIIASAAAERISQIDVDAM